MTALDTLLARASHDTLTEPGPDDSAIQAMVEAAVRAPDHGKLRPWRFVVIRGDARTKLGEIFAQALTRRDPSAQEKSVEAERQRPFRAPVMIALVAHVTPNHKIPEIEQLFSTAAAAMNFLNAAHALGWGAAWKTGPAVYDDFVHSEMGLDPNDKLLGFLYLGTRTGEPRTPVRPNASDFIRNWS